MGTIEEINSIRERYEEVMAKLELLERCDIIKEYHKLEEEGAVLAAEIETTTREKASNEQLELYKHCSHLRVCTRIEIDGYKVVRSYGCVKCGVNTVVLNRKGKSEEERVMSEYLRSLPGCHLNGIDTSENCDITLAMALYKSIRRDHPDADDETIRKYFRCALEGIRHKNMSRKEEDSKINRLSLRPGFANWYNDSVMYSKK